MALIKTKEQLKTMRESGRILASVMEEVSASAREGVRLEQLDRLARRLIERAGGEPAFLGYRPEGATRPYPASICASVNDVVVHGVPSPYALKNGDVLKLDFGVRYNGLCADAARTVAIGKITPTAQKLMSVTEQSLKAAISVMRPGGTVGDIGFAVERAVRRAGFSVIRGLTGHGIGERLHEDPSVPNMGKKGKGIKLESGMVLAVEPMTSAGSDSVHQREDEGYATDDGSVTAHFEHTIAITDDKPEILTTL